MASQGYGKRFGSLNPILKNYLGKVILYMTAQIAAVNSFIYDYIITRTIMVNQAT
jgi:hypothetical protein